MQKFLFDKEIVNNQLSVLNNTLASQRQAKRTLLSHLERFSDAMYENFNSDNTDSLLSLINEAHSIFECIKSNISKTLELKSFLENIYNSDFLNTIDSEKFNNDFNTLLENISKTNSSYLTFMNNYEKFINPTPIDKPEEKEELKENIETIEIDENIDVIEIKEDLDDSSVQEFEDDDTLNDDNFNQEESLFDTLNTQEDITTVENEDSLQESVPEINLEKTQEENIIEKTEVPEIIEAADTKETTEIPEIVENNENTTKDITIIEEPSEKEHEEHIEDIKPSIDLPEKELIIDKDSGIAILPYSISDLDELFLDDPEKYSSIQDIIDQEYTVDLKDFENNSITRYKEAFKLAKDKSNYTFSQAANFAKRFLVENGVTTLVIASCENVEELEFYIECLNNNRLQDFHHFKIIEK